MHPTVRMRDALLALRVALCVRSGSTWWREEGRCQHGGCEMQTKLKSVNLSHVVSSGTETENRRLTERGGGGERKGTVGRTHVLLSLRALLWLSV